MNTGDSALAVTANAAASLECFAVTDVDGVSPSVQGSGSDPYPDIPAPTIQQDGIWWGDSVTLNGNYLDLMPEENFLGLAAREIQASSVTDGGGGFATSATFPVPDDGRGAYAFPSTHGCSPTSAVPFVHLYPRGVSAYSNIHSIIYAPPTGHVWVSADGKVDEIDIFEHDPVIVRSITSYTKPYLSQCTTDGRILVVDGTAGVGKIDQIDASSGAVTLYANTADTGFTRPILPVGVAIDPDGSAGYIADATGGTYASTPVRFPANNASAITDNYGNWSQWSFPDPCGIEVGPTHQLHLGSTDLWTGHVSAPGGYPQYTQTYWDFDTIATPNALIVDRDVSTTSYDRYYYNDAPWAMAYNQNAIASLQESSPARFLGADVAADNGHLSLEPLWEYTVAGNAPKPVILNNQGHTYPYPTTYQTADRLVKLTARGWYNIPLHLRLIDPPDTSPYAPAGGWPAKGGKTAVPPYEAFDNDVWNEEYGDYGLTLNSDGSSPTLELDLPIGTDNTRTFYFKLPYRYAGDNWQVEVTKKSASGSPILNKIPSYSALFAGWKRVFVEKDRMFRGGGLLAMDFNPATCGTGGMEPACNQLILFDWANVAKDDQIVIFQSDRPAEGGDKVTATVTSNPTAGPFANAKTITLNVDLQALGKVWSASSVPPSVPSGSAVVDFTLGSSAGVGIVHSADGQITDTSTNQINATHSAFYDADMRDVPQPFADAYVELKTLLEGAGAVPYIPPSIPFYVVGSPGGPESTNRMNFQHQWNPHQGNPNYFYLLGCRGNDFVGTDLTGGYTDASAIHYSYIYVETLSTWGTYYGIPSALVKQALRQDTDHELGHNFRPNFCTNLVKCDDSSRHLGLHDYRGWWKYRGTGCPSSHPCLMFPGLSRPPTSINRFCVEDLILGDPNCSAPPPYPRQGAIRTLNDPMP